MVIRQYDILLINLDPTIGHEIKKSRPCLVISPSQMNDHLHTLIIAPMTTKSHVYPTRIPISFASKSGWIVLDQIRTIDKQRVIKHLGKPDYKVLAKVRSVIKEMLVD